MWNTFQVLGRGSLRSISACPLFISAYAWPWWVSCCTFLLGNVQRTDWGKILGKNTTFFFLLSGGFFFHQNLLLPLGLHGYSNTCTGNFVIATGRKVREKLAEGCWSWQCCRKGNPIKLCSEISQTFPLQQLWFKKFPSPSHFSSAQLFVSKKASPSLQTGTLAQLEREWGRAGTGAHASRCGDRRALLAGSAAKGQVMSHWSHFPGYRSWKMSQLELAESSHRRCNVGGVWREKVLFVVWCWRLRRTEWTVLWFLPFPHSMKWMNCIDPVALQHQRRLCRKPVPTS